MAETIAKTTLTTKALRICVSWLLSLCILVPSAGCSDDDELQEPEQKEDMQPYVWDKSSRTLTLNIGKEGIDIHKTIEELTTICNHSAPLSLKVAEARHMHYGGTDSQGNDTYHGTVNSWDDPDATLPWAALEFDVKELTFTLKVDPNRDGQRRWGSINVSLVNTLFVPDYEAEDYNKGYAFNCEVIIRQDYYN